ncbi:hypothetical protein ACF0H5_005561 [Mactra antiquata]
MFAFCLLMMLLVSNGNIKCVKLYKSCVLKASIVECKGGNLTFIPNIPDHVTEIVFIHNYLSRVTEATFVNVSRPIYVKILRLSNDDIVTIRNSSFVRFLGLKKLDVSGNPIEAKSLRILLGTLCQMKGTLMLNSVGSPIKLPDTFSLFNHCKINELCLEKNELTQVLSNYMQHLNDVKVLKLNNNKITLLQMSYMRRLEILYLSHNRLTDVPNFCKIGESSDSMVPNIEILRLDANKIFVVKSESFRCLTTLKQLDLSNNYLNLFPEDMLLHLPMIEQLEIRLDIAYHAHVEKYAFRSKSLKTLDLGVHGPAVTLFPFVKETFSNIPNLINLTIAQVEMFRMPKTQVYELFSPLEGLKYLTCAQCGMKSNPSSMIKKKKDLVKLNMSYNSIDGFDRDSFRSKKSFRYLFLSKNKFIHLSPSVFPVDFLNQLELLDLSENPFSCDCNLAWFIEWLKTVNKSKVCKLNDYICASPYRFAGERLINVEFTFLECHPLKSWLWAIIIGIPSLVVIIIIALIVYRNRWNIKHYYYLCRKKRNYAQIEGNDYLFDAFVSYNQEDSDWVIKKLLPVLEEDCGYKLCIHERDFVPGLYIDDNIAQCIQKSKTVILVLSNSYAISKWCIFELKLASNMHVENGLKLIVILLQEIKPGNINNRIKTVLQSTTYLEWTDDEIGVDLFWNKLKDAMREAQQNY